MQRNSLLGIWGGVFLIRSRFWGFSALQYRLIPAKTRKTSIHIRAKCCKYSSALCVCVYKSHYFVLFRRFGAVFSPSPEQMNLDASSSASPMTTTATSPSLPSSQLTVLLLAEGGKTTQARVFIHTLPLTFTGYEQRQHHL